MRKNSILLSFTLLLILMLASCGVPSADGGDGSGIATETFTGDVVTVSVPDGWSFFSGTDMNGANGADYICHSEKFEMGDPYLQTIKDNRDIEKIQQVLESEDTYGKYLGSAELNGNTWYLAEKAAAALIGEKVCLVLSYECDFESSEVQNILGSIVWAD